MKLSVKSEYAILALIHLARHYGQGPVTIGAVSAAQGIPKKYLEHILLALRNAGIVRSRKGAVGGYMLARDPGAISLAEIIRLMDGALAPVGSASTYFYEHTPVEKSEKLLAIFKDIRDYISGTMEGTTLKELI